MVGNCWFLLLLLEIGAYSACAKPGGPIFGPVIMESFFHVVLGKRCLGGDGNPLTWDNSSLYKQALIFTTFTITLTNTPCYVSVEIYVRDAAESLSCW